MTTNQKKNLHRKLGMLVGISTTVFSICGPVLQSVALADETTKITQEDITLLPTASSLINPNPEFESTTNNSFVEAETSSESPSVESSEAPSIEEPATSSSSSNTTDSSQSSTSSSTSGTSSTSSSTGGTSTTSSSSSSNSNNISSSTNSSSNNGGTNSSSNQNNGGNSSSSSSSSSTDKSTSSSSNTPITYTRNQSTAEFIEEIGEDARAIGQENDLYASVMIAQAILESGSGNSGLAQKPNHNLFGIKGSYEGSSVEMPTLEDNGSGGMYTISAKFRKYPSYKESLDDYATLMTGGTLGRSTFYHGAWKSNTDSYKDATKFLTGRYATDTRYNEKLNGLIETYQLTQYDQKEAVETKLKKSKETEAFIKEISAESKEIAGKNDLYASVLIADAIIQSSSGNSALAKRHNIFLTPGKYEDNSIEIETIVKATDGPKLETVKYKEYPSYEVGLTDYVAELKKDKDVYQEMTTDKKDNYRKVTAYLTAQNKEDRQYHKKLNALVATYDLTQFDKEVKEKEVKKTKVVATKATDEKKKSESIDILNKLGQTMTEKIFEGLEKPIKYQVTNK